MCFDYDEYPELFTERWVKARKPHVCQGCPRPIRAGELCNSYSGMIDEDFYSGYVCGACILTIFRIHLHELHEGCLWHQSWCQPYDLQDYCINTDFERSTQEEGQKYLFWKRESELLKKEAYAFRRNLLAPAN